MSQKQLAWICKGGAVSMVAAACCLVSAIASADDLFVRLMKFDADRDRVVSKDELTDRRLHALFHRYDLNKDGQLTKEEIIAGMERDLPGSSATSAAREPEMDWPSIGATRIAKPDGLGGAPSANAESSDARLPTRPIIAGSGPGAGAVPTSPVAATNSFPKSLVRVGQLIPDDLRPQLDLSDKQIKQIEELERSLETKLKSILNAKQFEALQSRLSDRGQSQQPPESK